MTREQEIAKELRESPMFDAELCEELCKIAGMEDKYLESDGESYIEVVYAAAEKIGVELE